MIAYTGRLMLESGQSLPIESSQINPSYRSDDVEVTWKGPEQLPVPHDGQSSQARFARGAEAIIEFSDGTAAKRRLVKRYRVPALDRQLIVERTRAEARLISAARHAGVPTPVMSDITADTIVMEQVQGTLLTQDLSVPNLKEAGRVVGKLHNAGIMHGDLTTSNMIMRNGRCVLIDFGLGQVTVELEQRGVDIHVLFQTLESTTPDSAALKAAFCKGYRETLAVADDVIAREHEIELRGRYL
jgi:N6-L-threonylcarbamoyladenine synthase/protein kinase Bud32